MRGYGAAFQSEFLLVGTATNEALSLIALDGHLAGEGLSDIHRIQVEG